MLSKNPAVIEAFKRRHRIGPRWRNAQQHQFGRRSFPAAAISRLTQDWQPPTSTGDSEIRFDICSLRDRSRELERADPLMKRFLSCLEKNVLKSGVGFSLQNKAMNPDATPDFLANQKVEMGFKEWSKKKNATENGEESLYEIFRHTLRSTARDGGLMLRKIIDPRVNEFGFALRMIEIDHLDVNYNTYAASTGNRIVMGVEKNRLNKTVAFHLLTKHPGDMLFGSSPYERVRIPATEIIHYFVKERVTQCVGVPWAAPSMLRMHHLEQYEIAELIASRAAANKGGFFTSEAGDAYQGENEQSLTELGTEKTGTLDDSEPGQKDELPKGMTFTPYDPTHPTQQYGDFTRDAKLSIAAGLDVSYATLVGDLTKSSFSSMRTGWLDERETYKKMQAHMIEHLALEIFETWLLVALTGGAINLPMSKFAQFNQPNFRGRRWPWVDPEKDVNARLIEINGGLATRDATIDESDSELDLEETFNQLAYEQALAKKKGLNFASKPEQADPKSPSKNGKVEEPEDSEDSEDRKILVARV
jgi:lambda family phage portal protein